MACKQIEPKADNRSVRGFTMIEILMVILLVAILGGAALPQFVDFRVEGKMAAARMFASNLRSAILAKKTQATLKCDRGTAEANPTLVSVQANDITAGGDCDAAQVPIESEREFLGISTFVIPENPVNGLSTLDDCTCTDVCDAACHNTAGYCYNRTALLFWGPGLEDCD